MSEKGYNGWTNYETWLFALWVNYDKASLRRRQQLAQTTWDDSEADGFFTREERATLDLAGSLRNEAKNENPLADYGCFWTDLVTAALAEINWYEIAEHLTQDSQKCLPSTNKRDKR
jgi:hypothetical protein